MRRRRLKQLCLACLGVIAPSSAVMATPVVQTLSDSHGAYYLVNNGALSFQLYTTGALAGKITSIIYNGQQMVGTKDFYYDIQGSPDISLGSAETYSVRTGSNFVDIAAEHPATSTEPLDVTWHFILEDNQPAFSTYLTYHHTTAMADYDSSENRVGAEFFNGNLFHYSSITDNYWGYQAAGDADKNQGAFITAETTDMKGIPSEYTKAYETKYDWRSTYAQSDGVTGIVTAANTSAATGPLVANDYGAWTIEDYQTYESWNSGPTMPQTPVADGASIIPSPAASHFGGPSLVYTGNMDKAFGPILTYFNQNTNINTLRADAEQYASGPAATAQDNFYDSLNLPYYATASQRGTVSGIARLSDGSSMTGATVILSAFDPVAYAADPIGQEYQRRAAGYNYWVSPGANGTYTLPDVRPGTYRLTVIKPGYYREGTYDNITVTAGQTTVVPNFTFVPDISGKGVFQIGTFDRSAGEFKSGNQYNNWIDTFNYAAEFPTGVNYTVNPANPFDDTQNWANNWGLNQINGTADFWKVNFNLPSAPAANATATITVSIADEEFINDLAALIGNNRVDASFDHTADNAPATFRSGDTSTRVLYRKMTFPASWLTAGNNTIDFHIIGGNMQWDAVRLDIQNPGTFSVSQWNGGTGNWTDGTQWLNQKYGYTAVNKGTDGIADDTSTTFTDGAIQTAPVNNTTSQLYYDAVLNGGTINLNATVQVQKLSLLAGTLNIPSGPQKLTANDAFYWAGANITGNGAVNALTTTAINFDNVAAGGAVIDSTGAVTWTDGATVMIGGAGTQWTTPGLSFGQGGTSTLIITSSGTVSTGSGTLTLGTLGVVNIAGGTLMTQAISTAGTFNATGSVNFGSGTFTNTGNATINGGLYGQNVVNNAGSLVLSGVNTFVGLTIVNGGVVQFTSPSSFGASGASVIVNQGGAVSYTPGISDPTFLGRLSTSSTGALALTGADSATDLDFTSALLAPYGNMALGAVGNVTYTGNYTPASNTYRLGGGGGTLTFAPLIAGASSVVIGNTGAAGAVILNSSNSYAGSTTLLGAVLSVTSLGNGLSNSPLGASSSDPSNLIIDGGTLSAAGPAATDRLFTIGAGGATLDGSGGVFFWTNGGVLSTTGSGNRTLTLTGSNTGNSFSPAVADPASGITALTKNGGGTWVLNSAAHTYSGDTTVLNGTLVLGSGAALPSGTGKGNLVVALGATFEMNGQDLTIDALNDGPAPAAGPGPNGNGGGIVDNDVNTQTLTIGANNAGGQFSGVISGSLNLVKNGSGTEILSGDNTYTGTTTINSGILQIGVGGVPLSTGPGDGGFRGKLGTGTIFDYAYLVFNRGYLTTATNLITGTGGVKQIANAELVVGGANTYTGRTIIGDSVANIGQGTSSQTGLAYTGDSSLNASVLANGLMPSSIGASSNLAGNLFLDGGTLFYSSTTPASTDRLFTVTQNGGAIYASGALTFSNPGAIVFSSAGDRTLSLGGDSTSACTFDSTIGDPVSGRTFLSKDRSVTWILNNPGGLTYSGDTDINMGTLQLGPGVGLPFGSGKGNVVFGTSTDFTTSYPAILEMNGNNLNINGLSGGVPNSTYSRVDNNSGTRTLTLGNNNTTSTFAGIVVGSVELTKTGTGTQVLLGTNTYTGGTSVQGGTLRIGVNNGLGGGALSVAAGALLDLNGTNQSVAGLSGAGTVDDVTAAGSPTLTVGGSATGTFSGIIKNTTGTVSLVQTGGTLILSGANTYAGGTTISSGTLQLGAGGSTGSVAGAITDNNALVLDRSGNFTFSNLISGNGTVALTGTGTAVFTANNTYAGPTTIASGALQLGAGGTVGAVTGNIVDNSLLVISRSDASLSFANPISGQGGLTIAGTGTVALTAVNTYGGSTTVSAGSLIISSTAALPSGTSVIDNSALAVKAGSAASPVILGGISGGGALTIGSAAAIGWVQLASGGPVSTLGSLTISSGSTLDLLNNALAINYGSVVNDPVATIRAELTAAYQAKYSGSSLAITSTLAGANPGAFAIGYVDNLATNQLTMKVTVPGDVTLDGLVDFSDLTTVAQFFGQSAAKGNAISWATGDVNYDNQVDFSDLTIVAQYFGDNLSKAEASALPASFVAQWDLALAEVGKPPGVSVPEPSMIALAVVGAAGLILHRNRRRTTGII